MYRSRCLLSLGSIESAYLEVYIVLMVWMVAENSVLLHGDIVSYIQYAAVGIET
jgi:hypothetical protein